MPITVESVFLEGIVVAVYLWLLLQLTHLKKCEQDSPFGVLVYLEVGFTTSSHISVVFNFMWLVAF